MTAQIREIIYYKGEKTVMATEPLHHIYNAEKVYVLMQDLPHVGEVI